ncbi:uncharacterized protein LOC131675941 [Topomyia yanbarensis]|uniref:uncharacterized protein LOC131675941 n=1 Tax=Topomyia yanbarensis TaxID=2498891 RepID=UPI00273C7CA9|nr:uncharacterized protein LOC131675941 [Topomyia yanbarensis]
MEENQTCTVLVNLSDVFHYAAGGSRLVVEGERVLNAGYLLIVGVEEVHKDGLGIFSTCLQSSSPSSEPHTIKIRMKRFFSEWSYLCSCKAGKGKCKHVMAVLYHLLKNPSLPLLTVTDLKQKWGKIAAKTAFDMYKATRLKELCFCKKWLDNTTGDSSVLNDSTLEETSFGPNATKRGSSYRTIAPDESENKQILKYFAEVFLESSLGYEIHGRPYMIAIDDGVPDRNSNVANEFMMLEMPNQMSSDSLSSLVSFDADVHSTIVKSYLAKLFERHVELHHKYFIGPLEADLFHNLLHHQVDDQHEETSPPS